jgi:hypothetical protein
LVSICLAVEHHRDAAITGRNAANGSAQATINR